MKNLLFITMLLGIGYSWDWECEDYNDFYGTSYICECNYDTFSQHHPALQNCWLPNVDFEYLSEWWELDGIVLAGAYLYNANLEAVYFNNANLSGADLYGASFYSTFFNTVFFNDACLEDAMGFTQTNYYGTPILEGCAETWGEDFEDTDGDGYDDESYDAGFEEAFEEGFEEGALSGDANGDGESNILDIVFYIEQIFAE